MHMEVNKWSHISWGLTYLWMRNWQHNINNYFVQYFQLPPPFYAHRCWKYSQTLLIIFSCGYVIGSIILITTCAIFTTSFTIRTSYKFHIFKISISVNGFEEDSTPLRRKRQFGKFYVLIHHRAIMHYSEPFFFHPHCWSVRCSTLFCLTSIIHSPMLVIIAVFNFESATNQDINHWWP